MWPPFAMEGEPLRRWWLSAGRFGNHHADRSPTTSRQAMADNDDDNVSDNGSDDNGMGLTGRARR